MFLGFMSITHAIIATAGVSLILGTAEPLLLGLAIVGSQLPDIDTTTSTIGKIFFPLSSWIEDRFPHRSITHSLLATGLLTAIALPIGHLVLGVSVKIAIALPLGHLLSCFSDTFTKQGVQLFYPNPAWAISVSNPRRRLKTGGAAELWVLAGAIALLTLGIYFASGGGITQKVSQNLGLRDSIVADYNENASTNHVYAEIKGVWASDRTSANGKYLILGTQGSEFIVMNNTGIYQTGEQIIAEKINTVVGTAAQTSLQTLSFEDEDIVSPLKRLAQQYPTAAIFVLGEITVDFPEDIPLELQPEQLQTLDVSGSKVKLNLCPLSKAIASLKGQYAVGFLQIKIVQPKPEGF